MLARTAATSGVVGANQEQAWQEVREARRPAEPVGDRVYGHPHRFWDGLMPCPNKAEVHTGRCHAG